MMYNEECKQANPVCCEDSPQPLINIVKEHGELMNEICCHVMFVEAFLFGGTINDSEQQKSPGCMMEELVKQSAVLKKTLDRIMSIRGRLGT